MKKAFLSTDFKKGKVHRNELNAIITPADRHVDAPHQASSHVKRVFSHEPSFFGSTELLSYLGDSEYRKIAAIDVDQPLYTAVDFPFKKLESDWHYIIYFLLNLSTSNVPKTIAGTSEFRTHIRVALTDNPSFEKLIKLTDQYLHSNTKSLIPEIADLINSIPSIKIANDKRKKTVKTVYRGLGFGEDENITDAQIIRKDKEFRFVATSENSYSAKNFALQKGHLDKERNSSVGYIITYSVTPDAIMFDTKVIDTIFGESEIVIDATKATIIDIEQV